MIINASYQENALPTIHIKMHYASLPNPSAKPVLSPGLISLHYSEFASNKHSNDSSVLGPSVTVGPRNNVLAGASSHRPWLHPRESDLQLGHLRSRWYDYISHLVWYRLMWSQRNCLRL